MSYKIEVTSHFKKQAKRLVKKFPSLKTELYQFINSLENDPEQGASIGNHCFKVRIAFPQKEKVNREVQNNYPCSSYEI